MERAPDLPIWPPGLLGAQAASPRIIVDIDWLGVEDPRLGWDSSRRDGPGVDAVPLRMGIAPVVQRTPELLAPPEQDTAGKDHAIELRPHTM
jgi:hypothetical protein